MALIGKTLEMFWIHFVSRCVRERERERERERQRERERERESLQTLVSKNMYRWRISFCTTKSDIRLYWSFVCFLSHAQMFKLKEFHSDLIWIPTVTTVFSSPEPKAHGWANSIPVTLSSIRQHFQTSSPLKPLGQLNSNFIWRLLRMREWKFVQMVPVTWPRWPPCPYMVKAL